MSSDYEREKLGVKLKKKMLRRKQKRAVKLFTQKLMRKDERGWGKSKRKQEIEQARLEGEFKRSGLHVPSEAEIEVSEEDRNE